MISLVVLFFFLIFYFNKPVMFVKANKCFLYLVITEILFCIVETLSIYLSYLSINLPKAFLDFLHNSVFILLLLKFLGVSLYLSFLSNVKVKKDIPTLITISIISFYIVMVLINPFTHFFYTNKDSGEFIKSANYKIIFFALISTIFLDIYYYIRYRQLFNKRGIMSCIFSILCLAICCFINLFATNYLASDICFLFVLFALFLAFENPDKYLDPKTRLYNENTFYFLIEKYLNNNREFSMIFFSIKNFKEKAQIYGILQRDLLLKKIGTFLLSFSKKSNSFYLYDGYFAVITKKDKEFSELHEEIIKRFKKTWTIGNIDVPVDILLIDLDKSINFTSPEQLASCYQIAFRKAMETSNNYITIDNDAIEESNRKTKVSKALNKALANDNLQLYLQPIFDTKTYKIEGAEALVRILDDKMGVIPPFEFITIAEKNGNIELLGEQMLNKVCAFIKETNIINMGVNWINVNLSPIQCQNKELINNFEAITKKHGINNKYIHLEITEESIIDPKIMKAQMNTLIEKGFEFSLDDFGSGFANVKNVRDFPFSNIKLDMDVVWDYFNSPDEMLPGLVKSFNRRGFSITAEGVETKEMAEQLEKIGCKYLQGYYFSKPLPAKDFVEYVKELQNINVQNKAM